MSKINEVRANPLYLREKRRSPRRIARWIFILAPTSVAAMAVIWGLIHGGSWSHLTDIPRLAVAHFPSLARKIVSEPSDLVLPAFMVILGGMMIHTPMSLWIRWNHPDIRCLRRDMYLTYLSTGAFFEGIFWGRMIPKIYAYGIPALFVSCILAIQGFWRLGLAMAIIPVDLLLWGAMSAGFAYRGNMLKPVGLAIMMPLAFVLHPFAWILIQNILPIDTLPYRLIDLLLGPSIPAIYGIKILVAIYIYRKLAKAGYPEDKV